MAPTKTWVKMFVGGVAMCIGGPAFVVWVMPSEEELFKKYNPDLQRRSLANREARQQEFDDYVTKLKEYSKSDKPIWTVAAEAAERDRKEAREREAETRRSMREEMEKQRQTVREAANIK